MTPAFPGHSSVPGTADLDNPLYYLENFETVVRWVRQHHSDLLTADETRYIDNLLALKRPERALLARMVMRSGELFRVEKLNYPELGQPVADTAKALARNGWIDDTPDLHLADLFRLFTLAELRPALADRISAAGLPPRAAKGLLRDTLIPTHPDPAAVDYWLPGFPARVIRLNHMHLFDRLRLMFFGNLRQSWSDFVLVELGHQQYEQVPLSSESRAFDERDDVDRYLVMHHCRERLDQGESPEAVWQDVPATNTNPWLESRRGRLLFELAKLADRGGNTELALAAYRQSSHREARLRQLRLLERRQQHREAWDLARAAADVCGFGREERGLERILSRLARKLGETAPQPSTRPELTVFTLKLDNPDGRSVEWVTMEHLSKPEAPVAYVENTLINGLFGLLCWRALFAPIPGAFFHPFHTGPADLHREDFVERRQALFDECLSALTTDDYKTGIRNTWHEKQGIASPFVIWPVLSEDLLNLALECIPARHLELMFRRLLDNLREHRSGFPDLIRFQPGHSDPDRRYEMIEVKGPGDRLQDHQTRWLEFCVSHGIPVSVCYVRWNEAVE
ncbi:VRR-NUC domain-containing protein [Marinobacter orientalis]|uniref:phosphodiesterase I n=1 Tax=Marinobacter orientalis TaxID=1928859 RepID=A0A7Y0NKG5_9GAMM|nr:VRR-NUC domain-containing protein [Marinobacter orientalis]NMT63070.1 VRR-NUC domain-containing protein [Marinobacter orientalis]TGX51730.1 VRR-NUC domain-containing protein [Marinobacter orientalis]